MFEVYNKKYAEEKQKIADMEFIVESALDLEEDDEVITAGDDIDNAVDTDSIPPEVMRKIDAEIDKLIGKDDYDDAEIEELIEDDDDELDDE